MERKRRKVTLLKEKMHNGTPVINTIKQVNSFVPNFIHSMDASHIIILLNRIEKDFDFSVVTIHDCFAVHANKAELLSHLVKESFITLYGEKDCIDKFHSHMLENIKAKLTIIDNQVLDVKGVAHNIPKKPVLGAMNLKSQLLESKYFIN